jgi:DNA-directed RNA polymerase specialized sigma24 family protein
MIQIFIGMQLMKEMIRVMISLLFIIEQADPGFKQDVQELFEEFSDMVYRIAIVRVSQSSDAEDIYQDVFLRMMKHVSKLRSRDMPKLG